MNPVVIDTMNDILNKVETREWRRITQQRDVLLRHKKRLAKRVETMQDDWAVATEKIGQENSDLHNEIKRLKDRNRNFENVAKEYEQRNNDLQRKNYDLEVALEERDEENERLKKERDDFEVQFHKTLENQANDSEEYEKQIENLKLELKAVKDANVMFMKRYEKKVEEEKKIDEVCSRIQCEDTFGHLIGRIPTQESSDSDSDSDDELDECFCCEKRFDSHNARYNMGDSLRLKYEKYYGSENDDGDICPECIKKNY